MVATYRKRVAILISGRGSNMQSILNATKQPDYPAEICLVISDNPDALGLETAQNANIETKAFSRADYDTKAAHETDIQTAINQANADLICLAGYMRILSADFTNAFNGRLINIHPSLLPKYKGLDTHQRAIDNGDSKHGCTVHFVNSEMDGGKIIAQASVPVLKEDTADSLASRVLIEEHKLYPKVIADLANLI